MVDVLAYKGKTLLSRHNPEKQGEKLALSFPLKENTLYLCPSPLYGYGLSVLLDRFIKEGLIESSAILCLELEQELFKLSLPALGAIIAEWEGKNSITAPVKFSPCTAAIEEICSFVRSTLGSLNFRRVEVLRLTGGWQLHPDAYKEIEAALGREIALDWGNAMTMIRLGRLFSHNFAANISSFYRREGSAYDIKHLNYGSAPILVIAAGPSLDTSLDKLQALSGIPLPENRPYRIIAVDTSLPLLLERGIIPDLLVILESQHWNLRAFTGAKGHKIDAAIDLSALPASGRVLAGKSFYFFTPWTELEIFTRLRGLGLLPQSFLPLGSVGLSAVAIALFCGSGNVVTCGLDFSFSLDKYHARSSPSQGDMDRKQNRFKSLINFTAAFRNGSFPALSKEAKAVRSDPALRRYRNLFEHEFAHNARLFDISGSGLDLGIKAYSMDEIFSVLTASGEPANATGADTLNAASSALTCLPTLEEAFREKADFINGEIKCLNELRGILSGELSPDAARLEKLLKEADYLWAHFPDCAKGKLPPLTDIGFLKRVRMEIEPFLRLWENP